MPKIYTKLLNVDNVDLVVSGYGTNSIAPAMPIVMRKKLVFMTLFGLAANEEYNYDRYFQIMPAGPNPKVDWSRGFIQLMKQNELQTLAVVGADAEYPKNALGGIRVNAQEAGLQIVYDESYPPSTTDFTPIIRAIQATNPDVVFVASYPPDSAGHGAGGERARPPDQAVRRRHGRPAVRQLADQPRADAERHRQLRFLGARADAQFPGHPGRPRQVSGARGGAGRRSARPLPARRSPMPTCRSWATRSTRSAASISRRSPSYIHKTKFDTVVGPVQFGPNGEWATSRVLMVQFQNIENGDLEQFKHAGKRVVLLPEEWASGELKFPYTEAKK